MSDRQDQNPTPVLSQPVSKASRSGLVFIFFAVVLDVLALGLCIPVLPKLVERFTGGDTAQAATTFGVFGTAWALMQFVFSPVLGMLSDRFGRRTVLLLSCFGLGLDYLLMAMAPSLRWLFVGRVISGIFAASFSTAGAYIADVTPPEKRAASFGLFGAAWGFGFVLGPALGGLLGGIHLRLPFYVAAALTLCNAMYGLLVLPESLPKEKRQGFVLRRANPIGALALLRSHRQLAGLALVNTFYHIAHHVLPSVLVLYASYRYRWTERTVGMTLAVMGLCSIAVQGAMVKAFVARLGERRALLTGIFLGSLGLLFFGLAPTGALFWAALPVFACIGLYSPSLQGLMTRRVQPSEQGQLQGANSSIMGLTGLVGPGLFTMTFSHFIGPTSVRLPGAPFLLASMMLGCALFIAWRVTRPSLAADASSESIPKV